MSESSQDTESPKPPSEMAFDEFADRIAGDNVLDKDIQQALLNDLASDKPTALPAFLELLGKRGKK